MGAFMDTLHFVPLRADGATLLVSLEPVNDNPPYVEGESEQSVNVSENHPLDGRVYELRAQDADTNAAHSTLTWCITGGNEEGKFGLDE